MEKLPLNHFLFNSPFVPHSLFLPVNNPYIGSINHAYVSSSVTKKDASTQTDPVDSMVIGEKIKKAYGDDYHILLS